MSFRKHVEAEKIARDEARFAQHLLDRYGLTLHDLEQFANEKFNSGQQWTAEDIAMMKIRQKEINKMATILMTKAEAMKKLEDAGVPRDISGDFHIIKILVALGIIMLEPEISPEQSEAREQFRQALDEVGHPEATCYSHWALEAYDRAFCPNLRK